MTTRATVHKYLWLAYLLTGMLVALGYFALPSSAAQNVVYDIVGFSAVFAILIGVWWHRPQRRLPWYLLALGDGLAVVGDLLWTYNENILGLTIQFPSLGDVLYLSGSLIFAVGVLLFARVRGARTGWATAIDTAIVAVGAGIVVWTFLIAPATAGTVRPWFERLVAGAYPAIDLLLLMAAVRIALGLTHHTVALRLLLLALAGSFITDLFYTILVAQGQYQTGSLLDACWLLISVLHGTLALHPSMRARAIPVPAAVEPPPGRLPLLALSVLIGPVILGVQTLRGVPVALPLLVSCSTVLVALVFTRLHLRDIRFRALVRHATDGIAIVDPLGRTVYQSPAAAKIFGHRPADLLWTDLFANVHSDDRERAQQLFAGVLSSRGETRAGELRFRHADGSWRDIEIHATDLMADASVGGIVINYRDVTERVRAEATLAEHAVLLEQIAQGLPLEETLVTLARQVEAVSAGTLVAINVLEDDGAMLRNVAAPSVPVAFVTATARIPVGEGVGACGTAAARGAAVISSDVATDPLWVDYRDLALAHGLRACWSIPIRVGGEADGRLLGTFAVYYGAPRQPGDAEWQALERSVGLAALAIERATAAAALQQGADSFNSLFDAAGEALMIHDGKAILVANATWAARFGYTPEELIGRDPFLHVAPAWQAEAIRRSRSGDEQPYEAALLTRDGCEIPVEVAGRTIRYRGKSARLVTQRDISERYAARSALEASEARFRALVQYATDVVTVVDIDGTILYQSPAAELVLGTDPASLVGRNVFALVHNANRSQLRELFEQLLANPTTVATATIRVRHRDGSWRIVEVTGTNLLSEPAVEGIVTNLRDVTVREAAAAALRQSEAALAAAQRIGHIGSWEYDIARDELRWSDEVFRISGYAPQSFIPTAALVVETIHPDDRARVAQALREVTEEGTPFALDCRLVRPDGTIRIVHQRAEIVEDERGRTLKLMGVLQDVTEQRALEERLAHQATHDALTGLPNRALLLDRVEQALGRARRGSPRDAILFLDLDRFKEINDTRGHDTGDRFLVAVAGRLRHALRDTDTLARLGGDEFVALLADIDDASEAARAAGRLLTALGPAIPCDGQEHAVTASIGIVIADAAYERAEDVLRDADLAMYRAKADGRAGYALFDPAMQAALGARLALERDLRLALERDELTLHYQPIVDLRTGRVVKVEALARWYHPTRGAIPPGVFITLAEEVDLSREVGRRVLALACQQAATWQRAGCPVPIAVNLTTREFQRVTLVDEVAAALAVAALDPRWLQLEITESLAMRDAAVTVATLTALRTLGVDVAIDDFGTGYSSLAYLKRLPVDSLKIDKVFVEGLETDPENAAIIAAVLSLGHTLGLRVVAEGVETAAQAAHLRALGCDLAQGYHFARPCPAVELTPRLLVDNPVPAGQLVPVSGRA